MSRQWICSVLVLGLLFLMTSAAPVRAGHTQVVGEVTVYRGTTVVRSYSEAVSCFGDQTCFVHVFVSSGDFNHILRCRDRNLFELMIPAGSTEAAAECDWLGPWSFRASAVLWNEGPTTHPADVSVNLFVDESHP